MPSSGDLFYPGSEPVALMYPTLAGRFFTTSVPGGPVIVGNQCYLFFYSFLFLD